MRFVIFSVALAVALINFGDNATSQEPGAVTVASLERSEASLGPPKRRQYVGIRYDGLLCYYTRAIDELGRALHEKDTARLEELERKMDRIGACERIPIEAPVYLLYRSTVPPHVTTESYVYPYTFIVATMLPEENPLLSSDEYSRLQTVYILVDGRGP